MIDLSIIIPVYNASALIRRCLDNILAQQGSYTYEVILVDDGSTDDSCAIIESYANTAFRLIKQTNAGPAAARNRGIELAKGRYIAFIDADDYWEKTFIEKTIGFLENNADCIAVSVGQRHLTVSGEFVAPGCLSSYSDSFVLPDFFAFWAQWMHVCTGSMIARSDAVKQLGGQREDLRITEDLEFWAYLATKGKWGLIPEILFTSDGTDAITNGKGWIEKMKKNFDIYCSMQTYSDLWDKYPYKLHFMHMTPKYPYIGDCIKNLL